MAKIPLPDHRMRLMDEQGNITEDFFRLILAIVVALNALS
jgi:hypothetical protein